MDFLEKRDRIVDVLESDNYAQYRRTQLFGSMTDIGETIRNAPDEGNVAGNMVLDSFIAAAPEAQREQVQAFANAIRSDAALFEAFDDLARNEGDDMFKFGDLFEGESAVDPEQFAEMMNNPAYRPIMIGAMDVAARDNDDRNGITGLREFIQAGIAAQADGATDADRRLFMQKAAEYGVEDQVQRAATAAALGGIEDIGEFLRNPSGALMNMGLSAELVAMLEPLLKFFAEAFGHYYEGFQDIAANYSEQTGLRAAELRVENNQVETTDDVGEIVYDENNRAMRVAAIPTGIDGGDLDASRHGDQVLYDVNRDGRDDVVTVNRQTNRMYVEATDSEIEAFQSAGGAEIPRTINLGAGFLEAVENRRRAAVPEPAPAPAPTGTGAAAAPTGP